MIKKKTEPPRGSQTSRNCVTAGKNIYRSTSTNDFN